MKLFASLMACFTIIIFGGCATKSHQEGPITLTAIVKDVEAHGVHSSLSVSNFITHLYNS